MITEGKLIVGPKSKVNIYTQQQGHIFLIARCTGRRTKKENKEHAAELVKRWNLYPELQAENAALKVDNAHHVTETKKWFHEVVLYKDANRTLRKDLLAEHAACKEFIEQRDELLDFLRRILTDYHISPELYVEIEQAIERVKNEPITD